MLEDAPLLYASVCMRMHVEGAFSLLYALYRVLGRAMRYAFLCNGRDICMNMHAYAQYMHNYDLRAVLFASVCVCMQRYRMS